MNNVAKNAWMSLMLQDDQGAVEIAKRALADNDGDVFWFFSPIQKSYSLFDYVLSGNQAEFLKQMLSHLKLEDIPQSQLYWQAVLPDQDALRCFDEWLGNQNWSQEQARDFLMHLFRVADATRFSRLLKPLSESLGDIRPMVSWALEKMRQEAAQAKVADDEDSQDPDFFYGIDYGGKVEEMLALYELELGDRLFEVLHELILSQPTPELSWTNLNIARVIGQIAEHAEPQQTSKADCEFLYSCLKQIFTHTAQDSCLEQQTKNQVAVAMQSLIPHYKAHDFLPNYYFCFSMIDSYTLIEDGAKALAELMAWYAKANKCAPVVSDLQIRICELIRTSISTESQPTVSQSAYDVLQALSEQDFDFESDFIEKQIKYLETVQQEPRHFIDSSYVQKTKAVLERWALRQSMQQSMQTAEPKSNLARAAALGL